MPFFTIKRPMSIGFFLFKLLGLARVSYGRRVAELDVVALGDSGGGDSLPGQDCYLSKRASSSASRRHLGDGYKHMRVVSKRVVPQGPNPLHN
ncbi:hypothetical protein BS78_01G185000 [Paspalum vaginatum]|nr:hypothetical protein BS78_01G185000 [Paspalum vaginatum]